jgi:ribonuclease J
VSVKICTHQAAETIGGNCVEIVSEEGRRLILDAGRPLELETRQKAVPPPSLDVEGDIEGLLISHAHADHWGLLPELPSQWPVHCGRATATLLRLNPGYGPLTRPLNIWPSEPGASVQLGPFTVRPYLIDHSIFDAYALQIDVDGRRVFYSGDFRGHGRKGVLTRRLVENPPAGVDALIMEGTNLGTAQAPPPATEEDLEERFGDLFRKTKGRVFVTWSSSNIDRMVTIYKAARRAGRVLVPDLYCSAVWREMATLTRGLPDIERGSGISAVVTTKMKRVLAGLDYEDMVPGLVEKRAAIPARSLEKRPGLWVAMIRPGLVSGYRGQVIPSADDAWVWSQWRGYLDESRITEPLRELIEFMSPCGGPIYIHTSGHASPALLRDFATALNPKMLVPIHGEAWREHQHDFPNMRILANGQWLEI